MKTTLTIFAALAVMTDSTVAKIDVHGALEKNVAPGSNAGAQAACADTNKQCPDWAKRGECAKNPGYMLPNCKVSCNQCPQNGKDNKTNPDKLKELHTELKEKADKLIGSLNESIQDMGKKFTVASVKKDSEIVAEINNNGAAVSGDYKNFGAVVDKIKKYEAPAPNRPDPKKVAQYKQKVEDAKGSLAKAQGKQDVDFQTSVHHFNTFNKLYYAEKKKQNKNPTWTKQMQTEYRKYDQERRYWSEFNYEANINAAQTALAKAEEQLKRVLAGKQPDAAHDCIKKYSLGTCQRCTNDNQCGDKGVKGKLWVCSATAKLCMQRGKPGCKPNLSAMCKLKKEFIDRTLTPPVTECQHDLAANKCTCKHEDWNSGKWQKPTCEDKKWVMALGKTH